MCQFNAVSVIVKYHFLCWTNIHFSWKTLRNFVFLVQYLKSEHIIVFAQLFATFLVFFHEIKIYFLFFSRRNLESSINHFHIPKIDPEMESSHSLTLNEDAFKQIPDHKKPVYVFEWLRYLDRGLVAAQKVFFFWFSFTE